LIGINVHYFEFYRAIYSPCIPQELWLKHKLDLGERKKVGVKPPCALAPAFVVAT
jgi:hypothetical protein